MVSHTHQLLRSLALMAALTLGLVGLTALVARPADAQIRASERAMVRQTIDGTTLTIDYARPSARGRELFGALVPWGGVWTPGANWATTLTADRDIRINGVEVPAGSYSVWAMPRPDRFTVSLNPTAELMHFMKPDSTDEQIHISAEPVEGEHEEFLTWSFPNVRGDAAVLQFQWGTTAVPMQVLVEPSAPVALSPEERAMYVGAYEMSMNTAVGWPESGVLEVFEEDGRLRGRMPFGIHPEDELTFDLVPAGEGRFNPGLYREGALFGVELAVNIDFELGIERAERVHWRGPLGTFFGEGERVTQDR
jgi:hypothetical protein